MHIRICISLVGPTVTIAVPFAVLHAGSRPGDEAKLFSIFLCESNSIYSQTLLNVHIPCT